jgi:hypothetical protein
VRNKKNITLYLQDILDLIEAKVIYITDILCCENPGAVSEVFIPSRKLAHYRSR